MAGSGALIGQTISHYRILERIGGGGMGVVYKAEDTQLGRPVALKFLSEPLVGDKAALQRFQQEARMASALDHPNICTIYEIGEHAGLPFIAMQYLEGQTLERRITDKPLPIEQVITMGIQIADALEAAHAKGITHRDIKPSNIYITKRDQPKILDFGVAKLTGDLHTGASAASAKPPTTVDGLFTAPGARVGTFAYMSPEQERGDELDARSDLFSFGLLLYDMATGWHSLSDKVASIIHQAVGSQEAAVQRPAELPPELAKIISKATQVDRGLRYQSAAEMRGDLERLHVRGEGQTSKADRRNARTRKLVALAAISMIAVAISAVFFSRRTAALTAKDTIVLADFDNKTGDPVFEDALKQAMTVDLEQSPFLNILSDRRMAATLRLMGRAPDQPVTGEVARELCQRVGSKAMLAGSISALGANYVIGLSAINCANGDTLVKEQVEAQGKESVLKALGRVANDMRGKLGESLASVQKFAMPIEEATTPSLEALKAYSMGRRALNAKGDVAAVPYYQQAVELDPNFALAYRSVAVAYNNLGQVKRASENAKRAFELRERVSERERYAIDAFYYSIFIGDEEKANQVYELWAQSYPRDLLPLGNLGDAYMRLGQWEKALRDTESSLLLEPNFTMNISNSAWMQLALNRPAEARATIEQALSHQMDTLFLWLALYQSAFVRNEQETMQQQLTWAAGRPGTEDWLLSAQSDTEAYFGRLAIARRFSKRAIDSATRADAKETAALWQANAALREAEFGNYAFARQYSLGALALAPGRDVRSLAALALARTSDSAQVQKLAENVSKDFPQNTIVQGYWLPSIHAATEIKNKNAARAVELLQPAEAYELGQSQPFQVGMMYPVYLRGQAYLLGYEGKEAEGEFQKILNHSGIVLNFPLGALAHLGLARSYVLQGDTSKARAAYENFLALWRDADRDIPILKQAKAEYAKLQ